MQRLAVLPDNEEDAMSMFSMSWMFIPLTLLGLALPLYFVVKLMRGSAERNRLLTQGAPAMATIMQIWETGTRINDRPMVGFALQVQPPQGQPWQAQCQMVVSPLQIPSIQPGTQVHVKYDPADPSKVAIVM